MNKEIIMTDGKKMVIRKFEDDAITYFCKIVNGKEVSFREGDEKQAARCCELALKQGAEVKDIFPIKLWANWIRKNAA